MSLQFQLPASLTAEKFIAKLSDKAEIQFSSKRYCLRTYYDSFDWRLWSHGILCELNRSKTLSSVTLRNLKNGRVIGTSELADMPAFGSQFQPEKIRGKLEPLLEMRALLPVSTLDFEAYHLNLINEDQKTVLRLIIEDYELFPGRVLLQPIKGYGKFAGYLVDLLTTELGLTQVKKPVLLTALHLQGRNPKDYSSRLNIDLDPAMRADIAGQYIYSQLLKTVKDNEQGVIADTDSEFLHDFRVAVRRTRTGLSQLKGILPDDLTARYAEFFSWLGQITSPTRDLDVHLLNFERYKQSLPLSIREDLNPLLEVMREKKQKAQQELAAKLKSVQYKTMLLQWEQHLKQRSPVKPCPPNADLTIKELADRRIWKVYNRVLREGETITPLSPAPMLHGLRKTCKKLRYLMEFFQNLYPEHQIKHLIKDLKALQEILGDFQDYEIQERSIKMFSEEMKRDRVPEQTLLAMDVLIQILDTHKLSTRKRYSSRFEAFKQPKNHSAFKTLCTART